MIDFVMLSTTVGNAVEANKIANQLVERRLAACVQIIPQVRSVYHWQGRIEQSDEWLCLVKTRRSLVAAVEAVVLELHSYDCPEIVVTPIESGSDAYLGWLDAELQS